MSPIEKLKLLVKTLSKRNGLDINRIKIWEDDDDRFGIDIDDKPWSNYLLYEEMESSIRDIFKGIEIGRQLKGDD